MKKTTMLTLYYEEVDALLNHTALDTLEESLEGHFDQWSPAEAFFHGAVMVLQHIREDMNAMYDEKEQRDREEGR